MEFLQRVSELADRYDAFLLDLWGVIHDGSATYPEVHDSLEAICKAGKTIIFLSNAPRRAAKAIEGLERLKVTSDLYHHVVTSGEVAFERIRDKNLSAFDITGNHYLYVGPERDGCLLEGLGYERTEDASKAAFVLVTGYDNDASPIDEKQAQLDAAIAHKLPLICANPDIEIVRITGVRAYCAGVIARKYEEMGGVVQYFGKPYPGVYRKALDLLDHIDSKRIAAIGDSLITDIKGANAMGIDSYLIAGGILGQELGIEHGELPDRTKLEATCKREGITPTGVLPALAW